ncbi:MAG TPA: hypothetical protein VHY35_24800 [Stellaceae bacterium]|jgi:hypothetical protein|nr:hypothetical protein [Stellaceae bacterium]
MILAVTRIWLAVVMVASLGCHGAAEAQEFSADLVVTRAGDAAAPATGRIFVAENKIRIETPDLPDGVFLLDTKAGSAIFLRPARGVMMDARETSLLTQLLVPVAPEMPCASWQAMAVIAGAAEQGGQWQCARRDAETIAGRDLIHYALVSPRNLQIEVWIDVARRFPVRLKTDSGETVALDHFFDNAPRPDLFAVPAGTRRFDPEHLIDRIKQSDVWVEPPK